MANTKISQLTANTNPSGSEEMVYALNNANGKMSLNTMKTFVENNLTWYATTSDLTTWLAWKQDTLVSWTNIRTINGASVVWSWDIIVTWWTWYTAWPWIDITWWVISATWWTWGSWFDCTVASDWTWDYTTISDAITAWKKSLFVKDWTYTMSTWTLSTWDFKMVWESKNWVVINITYPTRSWTIFTMTSNTTDLTHGFLISNITFNITYTWNFWYFVLFDIPDKWFLTLDGCNICVVSADDWCNFYLCDSSWQVNVNWCYIEVYPSTWNPQWLWFLWINNNSTCEDSIIVVDAAQSLSISEFNCTPTWLFIWCKFLVWKTHNTSWDVVLIWCSTWIRCSYESSSNANQRIYWYQQNSSFSQTWTSLTYDSNLNTAVKSKKITIWKPSTSYTVWDYVMSWNSQTLARCITAHTSWATFDSTKFENVYGDTFINWNYHNCTFRVWWTTIIAWIATYYDGVVQPASMWNISNCEFRCYTSSSAQPNYCNIVVLSHRWFVNNRILNQNETVPMYLYLWWECSVFTWNRILSALWNIYSWWYGNVITNNIFTYITWWTTPTITQVTSWASEIANNVIRWVADWDS